MKNPIVITSLEEDFKKISLIRDTKPMQESVEQDENLDEVEKQNLTTGGTRSGPTRQGHKEYMKYKRSVGGKKALKKKAKAAAKAPARRRAAKLRKKRAAKGLSDAVASTGNVVAEKFDAKEALKSFANAAIIAEKLQLAFLEWVKGDLCESAGDESEFLKLAAELAVIAEEFAEVATALNEGTELDTEELSELFAEGLETVLDAVDLYEENEGDDASVTEKAEMDDEESEDGESEDEDEEMEEEVEGK